MGAAGPQVAVPELFIARIMPLGYFNTRVEYSSHSRVVRGTGVPKSLQHPYIASGMGTPRPYIASVIGTRGPHTASDIGPGGPISRAHRSSSTSSDVDHV